MFISSLGTGAVFEVCACVPLPTRMKFRELPPEQRPTSEAAGSTRNAPGLAADRDMMGSVIERWRASTMSHKGGFEDDELGSWRDDIPPPREDSPPIQPAQVAQMAPPMPPRQLPEPAVRASILRKPLGPENPAPLPSRYRPT